MNKISFIVSLATVLSLFVAPNNVYSQRTVTARLADGENVVILGEVVHYRIEFINEAGEVLPLPTFYPTGNPIWSIVRGTPFIYTGDGNVNFAVLWNQVGNSRLIYNVSTSIGNFDLSIPIVVLPPTPQAIVASAVTGSSFVANWIKLKGGLNYRLDVSTSPTFTSFVPGYSNVLVTGGLATTKMLVTGLSYGVTYYYRVRMQYTGGTTVNSNVISILNVPPVIGSVTILGTTRTNFGDFGTRFPYVYTVEFKNSDGEVIGAPVFTEGPTWSFPYGSASSTSSELSCTVVWPRTGLFLVRYQFKVGTKVFSASLDVVVRGLVPVATALQATNITASSFTANWAGTTPYYELDVSRTSDFSSFLPGYEQRLFTGTQAVISNLQPNTRYYYRVRGMDSAGGISVDSNTILVGDMAHNFIRTTDITVPGKTTDAQVDAASMQERRVQYDYFDDLGRKDQTVLVRQSPTEKDIIQPMAYNAQGREARKYLPYTKSSDGRYQSNALLPDDGDLSTPTGVYEDGEQFTFYQGGGIWAKDAAPYSETIFETSPMNRVLQQGAAGALFQPDPSSTYYSPMPADRSVKNAYEANASGEVLLWTWIAPSINSPEALGRIDATDVSSGGRRYYRTNELQRNRTKDEHHHEVITYTNKDGRTILKRLQVVEGSTVINDTNYASTYYVYNVMGDLVCVIPPEAVKLMTQTAPVSEYFGKTDAEKEAFLKRWAFRYKYDARRRVIQKQVPGAGQVWMVYDHRDRLALTQDSVQRPQRTWLFTKYDGLDRPVATGTIVTDVVANQRDMQGRLNSYYSQLATNGGNWFETYVGPAAANMHGYDNRSYPPVTAPQDYFTVNYYDQYDFKNIFNAADFDFKSQEIPADNTNNLPGQITTERATVKGQPTGSKIRSLDGRTFLKFINYYDDEYRLVQHIGDHGKGHTVTTNVYDFTGKLLRTKSSLYTGMPASWTNLVNAQAQGDILVSTGTSNWAQGATSVQILPANTDGWVEMTIIDDLPFMIGLADQYVNSNYAHIDYAWFLNGTALTARESGTRKGGDYNANSGDILRVERVNNTIYYKRNGAILYTSLIASATPLMVYVSLHNRDSKISQTRLSNTFNNPAPPISAASSFIKRFTYDYGNRLIDTWHRLDNGPEILLSHLTYNELGQLIDKKLHSTVSNASDAKQSVDYRYNIRGWLTSINNTDLITDDANDDDNDLFGMNLGYYEDLGSGSSNDLQYNGNISAITWSNSQGLAPVKAMAYNFRYDPLNRLVEALHQEASVPGTWAAGQYDEKGITYDLNGNIRALQRRGKDGALIDNLTYNYGTLSSNKLQFVTDGAPLADKMKGFIDGSTSANDYTYDGNGNMLTDRNRGISTVIAYNHLNLPQRLEKAADNLTFLYDASGTKLAKLMTFGLQQRLTEYVGPWIFEDNMLKFLQHDEGRIVIGRQELMFRSTCDTVTGVTPAVGITLSNETIQEETYLKVTGVTGVSLSKKGITNIGGTFDVEANERYLFRVKGYWIGNVGGSLYVQANNSTDLIWRTAHLRENASEEKWVENFIVIPEGVSQIGLGVLFNATTTGGEKNLYINEIELYKVDTGDAEYQYHLKDYLGNIRLTFTTREEVEENIATLEAPQAGREQGEFLRYSSARKISSNLFDHTNGKMEGYAQLLRGGPNETYGLGKTLSVMPGDVVKLNTYAKYVDSDSSQHKPKFKALLQQVVTTAATPGNTVDGLAQGTTAASFPFAGLNGTSSSEGTGPRAFLNWLVFDKDFKFVSGGYARMSDIAKEHGQDVAHEKLSGEVRITEPGYVYVYVSNEQTVEPYDVYFDDFSIMIAKSQVIQMDDYYPFGLTFNSYQRENAITNNYQYNGKETQNEFNLGWVDYGARMYQPAMGRWNTIDLLAHRYDNTSPYAYGSNNPIFFSDIDGMEIINGATQDKERAKKKIDTYKSILIPFEQIGTRRKDFANQNTYNLYKAHKKLLRAAEKDYKAATRQEARTRTLINDLQQNTPNMYNKLNSLKNEYGETVDVYLSTVDDVEGPNDGASLMAFEEQLPLVSMSGKVPKTHVRPVSVRGRNSIEIHVTNNPSGNRTLMEVTKHEFGHTDYQAENTAAYSNYLKSTKKSAGYDGHASDDLSGQRAEQYQQKTDLP